MNGNIPNVLVSLGQFATSVAKSIDANVKNIFPVLGAEGDHFFIQICAGVEFNGRTVLKTIHVNFDAQEAYIGSAESIEPMVKVQDASHLVGLVSLLQTAFDTSRVLIHHPLTDYGDYLPQWDQAVMLTSLRIPS